MGRLLIVIAICLAVLPGCARLIVRKNPGPNDPGVRYYRPKPYLFIGPGGADNAEDKSEKTKPSGNQAVARESIAQLTSTLVAYADTDPATREDLKPLVDTLQAIQSKLNIVESKLDEPVTTTLQPVVIKLDYLPDYSEEYSFRVTPGLGTSKLSATLEHGWNLTAINAEADQKYAEILASIAQLVNAASKAPGGGNYSSGGTTECQAESNVPMGYYEAVIARDECGRKQMMGWRYVGFMPCSTCPVNAHVCREQAVCDDDHIYGLVIRNGILQMKKMRDLKSGGQCSLNCDDCNKAEELPVPTMGSPHPNTRTSNYPHLIQP